MLLDIDDIENKMIYDPVEEVMVDADEFEDIEFKRGDVWLSGPRVKTES